MTTMPTPSALVPAAATVDTHKNDVALTSQAVPDRSPIDLKAEAALLKQNMTFGEIDNIKHPVLRSIALMSTSHPEPWTPYWRHLIKSVDVPEAGTWGRQAQALLDRKPPSGRAKKRLSSGGNLFLSFAEDLATLVDAEQLDKPTAVDIVVEAEDVVTVTKAEAHHGA